MRFYSALILSESDKDHDRYLLAVDPTTKDFYSTINNAKVLIIGPRPTVEEIDELDEFDVVVVMNYHGPARLRDEILQRFVVSKSAILVSYFGNNASDLLSGNDKKVTWELSPDFVVLKSDLFAFQRQMLTLKNARTLNSVDNILSLGSGNFLQQCLYDILFFKPALVKIIGLDFWVGESLYDAGYKINKSDEKFPRYSFAAHNVFSNWLFPKALRHAGLIQCSDVVGDALDLDFFEYADALSRQYPFEKFYTSVNNRD